MITQGKSRFDSCKEMEGRRRQMGIASNIGWIIRGRGREEVAGSEPWYMKQTKAAAFLKRKRRRKREKLKKERNERKKRRKLII